MIIWGKVYLILVRLINKFMGYLKLDKIILLGHSLGCYIAYNFIYFYPEKVVAYISLAGIVKKWYNGIKQFYVFTV